MKLPKLFHTVAFRPIDPLGGGLAEDIAAERAEPEAIRSLEDEDGAVLVEAWDHIAHDMHESAE